MLGRAKIEGRPRSTTLPDRSGITAPMAESVRQFVADLQMFRDWESAEQRQAALQQADAWRHASDAEIAELLIVLERLAVEPVATRQIDSPLLDAALGAVAQRSGATAGERRAPQLDAGTVLRIERLYRQLGTASKSRKHLLAWLARDGGRVSLAALADLLVSDPPGEPAEIDLACAPLFQLGRLEASALFPRLLDALAHPVLAAIVLDLANYLTRRGDLSRHPTSDRADKLCALLDGFCQQLQQIEQGEVATETSSRAPQRVVGEAVGVLVSLCDALAMIGDPRAVEPLERVLELGHRRLRAEAAAALARLGGARGVETLRELAADPASRSRALAYLEEIGDIESVPATFRNERARAEAAMADWLGEPQHFGMPPHRLSVLEQRKQHWPGYERPVDCFLVQFEYSLVEGPFVGVGLVGPLTHCVSADVLDLGPDDIFGLYAGWSTEHPELALREGDALSVEDRAAAAPLAARYREQGFDDVALASCGDFFDEGRVFVFGARRESQQGSLVVHHGEARWIPAGNVQRPIGAQEAWWIHIGRRLLETFNS